MRKFFAGILLMLCFGAEAQVIVNDPTMQLQQLLNFMSEMEEVAKQEMMVAEELQMKWAEFQDRTEAQKAEMKRKIDRAKKCLNLYEEIRGCYDGLEDLRKNLLLSNYLSINEKYSIYSRAQMICYDVIMRTHDIDKMVDDIKEYNKSEGEGSKKEEKLDKILAVVREVKKRIGDMQAMAVKLVNHKRSLVNTDLKLRRTLNVKLF